MIEKKVVSLVAAMSENRVIGTKQALPWHIPLDLKRFKAITAGHVCIMGRKTFDSIGKPLPNRPNYVVTRNPDFKPAGVVIAKSLKEAIEKANEPDATSKNEIMILGGGEIYSQAIPFADKIYLTVIHRDFEGDTVFPEFDKNLFRVTFREDHTDPIPFSFIDYIRT